MVGLNPLQTRTIFRKLLKKFQVKKQVYLAAPGLTCGMWGLLWQHEGSSSDQGLNWDLCTGSVTSLPLDHQGSSQTCSALIFSETLLLVHMCVNKIFTCLSTRFPLLSHFHFLLKSLRSTPTWTRILLLPLPPGSGACHFLSLRPQLSRLWYRGG